jgi:hypothetical protein
MNGIDIDFTTILGVTGLANAPLQYDPIVTDFDGNIQAAVVSIETDAKLALEVVRRGVVGIDGITGKPWRPVGQIPVDDDP